MIQSFSLPQEHETASRDLQRHQSYFAHVVGEMRNLQENVSVIKIGAVTVTTTTAPVGSVLASSCLDSVL